MVKFASATIAVVMGVTLSEAKPPCHHHHNQAATSHDSSSSLAWSLTEDERIRWKHAQMQAHDACLSDAKLFCGYHDENENADKLAPVPPVFFSLSKEPAMPLRDIANKVPAQDDFNVKSLNHMMDEMMDQIMMDMKTMDMDHDETRPVPFLRASPAEAPARPAFAAMEMDDDAMVDQLISSFLGVPVSDLASKPRPDMEVQRKDEEEEEPLEKLVPVESQTVSADVAFLQESALFQSTNVKPLVFVNYCRTSCHWCHNMFSTWETVAAAGSPMNNIEFVFVDCDERMELCRNEQVYATPSLRLYNEPGSSMLYEEYFGDRSLNSLEMFLDHSLDQLKELEAAEDAKKINSDKSSASSSRHEKADDSDPIPFVPHVANVVQSNKHDFFYLDSKNRFGNSKSVIEQDDPEDVYVYQDGYEVREAPEIAAYEHASESMDMDAETQDDASASRSKSNSRSYSKDSSSKDMVTPLDYAKEERRVSRFAELLEPTEASNSKDVPDLRRRLSRRLTELAPVVEHHLSQGRPTSHVKSISHAFDSRYGAPMVPNMGFTPMGSVEKCLVQNSAFSLSSGCAHSVQNLQASLYGLEEAEDVVWWMAVAGIYAAMIFVFVGLFLFKRVQQKKLKSFHKDRKLRQDVLRVIHGDAELKAKVETALGLEESGLDEETMTMDPMASFKKKLGCMGMCCLTLPRLAIFVIYMCAVVAMPALIWTVLVPTLCCMSLYGYAMHCCGSMPKDDDEEEVVCQNDAAAHLGYPAAVAAKTRNEDGSVYEAIPVI